MEGLDQRQINQRIDLLNYPLMTYMEIGDDSYLYLPISHFSVYIMTEVCHDLIPIYPRYQWTIYSTIPCWTDI